MPASQGIVLVLCGNKRDLDADREVTFLEASQFAQENELTFLETSALEGGERGRGLGAVCQENIQQN